MNRDDKTHPGKPDSAPPSDGKGNSGEGADTALKALIQKRKLQGDDSDTASPAPPAS